jgi:hypothetical protein
MNDPTIPTWADVQDAARRCPVLHYAATLADRGDCTREQAMTIAALFLSRLRAEMIEVEIARLRNEPRRRA